MPAGALADEAPFAQCSMSTSARMLLAELPVAEKVDVELWLSKVSRQCRSERSKPVWATGQAATLTERHWLGRARVSPRCPILSQEPTWFWFYRT